MVDRQTMALGNSDKVIIPYVIVGLYLKTLIFLLSPRLFTKVIVHS